MDDLLALAGWLAGGVVVGTALALIVLWIEERLSNNRIRRWVRSRPLTRYPKRALDELDDDD